MIFITATLSLLLGKCEKATVGLLDVSAHCHFGTVCGDATVNAPIKNKSLVASKQSLFALL